MERLYTASEIARKVTELGNEISQVYKGQELFVIGILKGGSCSWRTSSAALGSP